MNIVRENISDLNAILKLTIEKVDYEETVSQKIKDYKKKIQMPGFRPGMVPTGLVKKLYGKAILAEEINKMVFDQLHDYIKNEGLDILGEPLVSHENQKPIDFESDTDFEFAFEIGLAPQLEVELSEADTLPYHKVIVDQEMIDNVVENQRSYLGGQRDVDTVEEKDMLKGSFIQADPQGNPVEGGIETKDSVLSVQIIKDEAIRTALIGASVGSEIVFEPVKAYPNAVELAAIFEMDKDQVEEGLKGIPFRFRIDSISRFMPSSIDETFFAALYPEGDVTTEEEHHKRITQELEKNYKKDSSYLFIKDLREYLMSRIDISLPDAFLQRWLLETEQVPTAQKAGEEYARMHEDLKWQLIKNKLAVKYNINVESAEIIDYTKAMLQQQFMAYGLYSFTDDDLNAMAKRHLESKEKYNSIREYLLEQKLVEKILEIVSLDVKEYTKDEFHQLIKSSEKQDDPNPEEISVTEDDSEKSDDIAQE